MKPTTDIIITGDLQLKGCLVDNWKELCWKCIWLTKDCTGKHIHHKLVASQNQQPKDYDYDLPRAKRQNDTGTG